MKLKNTIFFLVVTFLISFAISCGEDPEPQDPCNDNQWATAILNGVDHCMGKVSVNYFHPNTALAIISFSTKQANSIDFEINADFSVPLEGLALNTPYSIKSGQVNEKDDITEGTLTLLVFDPPAVGKPGCIAGTFSITAQSEGVTTYNYTDGKFVYYKGTTAEEDNLEGNSAGCNPF